MRHTIACLLMLPFASLAQTTWNVQVGGSTSGGPPPFYAPQNLTIAVGDQVTWTNTSGTHNVNGTTALFPGNPESFSSGEAQFGGWTHSHIFTITGTYNYHCTQQGHSSTQFGQIVVQGDPTSVEEVGSNEGVLIYPVPANDVLVVELGALVIRAVEVISLDGQRVVMRAVAGASRVEVGLQGLAAGAYFLRLIDDEGRVIVRPFRKA